MKMIQKPVAEPKKFWMLAIKGRPGPKFRHETLTQAITEAGRLAERLKRRVYVLEAIGSLEREDQEQIDADHLAAHEAKKFAEQQESQSVVTPE